MKIPEIMKTNIDNYVASGYLPGTFLEGIITNDVLGVIGRADLECRRSLADIIDYVRQQPSNCWGSQERMTAWSLAHGLRGGADKVVA